MKIIPFLVTILTICSFSRCLAVDSSVERAYSLYSQGQKEAAIVMVEDTVQENPDPGAYYFLGYAYYEMKDMDKAMKYFNEAYRLQSFYSPMISPVPQ